MGSRLIDHEMKCRECNGSRFCEEAMRIIDDEVIKTLRVSFPDDPRFDDELGHYAGVD